MRYKWIWFIIIALLIIAGFFYLNSKSHKVQAPSMNSQAQRAAKDDLIIVETPLPNQQVSSPLEISGQARGNWYFEAVFPIKLLDANGKVLAQGHAQAQGDWMTSAYVPFTAQLIFIKPGTAIGILVLSKDNPSDLPQNDNELRIPVNFK